MDSVSPNRVYLKPHTAEAMKSELAQTDAKTDRIAMSFFATAGVIGLGLIGIVKFPVLIVVVGAALLASPLLIAYAVLHNKAAKQQAAAFTALKTLNIPPKESAITQSTLSRQESLSQSKTDEERGVHIILNGKAVSFNEIKDPKLQALCHQAEASIAFEMMQEALEKYPDLHPKQAVGVLEENGPPSLIFVEITDKDGVKQAKYTTFFTAWTQEKKVCNELRLKFTSTFDLNTENVKTTCEPYDGEFALSRMDFLYQRFMPAEKIIGEIPKPEFNLKEMQENLQMDFNRGARVIYQGTEYTDAEKLAAAVDNRLEVLDLCRQGVACAASAELTKMHEPKNFYPKAFAGRVEEEGELAPFVVQISGEEDKEQIVATSFYIMQDMSTGLPTPIKVPMRAIAVYNLETGKVTTTFSAYSGPNDLDEPNPAALPELGPSQQNIEEPG